jgi:hypothetical protein
MSNHNFKIGELVYHCGETNHKPRQRYPIIDIRGDIIVLEYKKSAYPYPSKHIEKISLKIWEEFTKAKELMLSDEVYRYICWALCSVNTQADFNSAAGMGDKWEKFQKSPSPAAKIIRDRLGNTNNLENWVVEKVGSSKYFRENGFTKSMRTTRLAWLDSLISEFKSKDE